MSEVRRAQGLVDEPLDEFVEAADPLVLAGPDELPANLVVGDLRHDQGDALVKEAERPLANVSRLPRRRGVAEQSEGSAVEDDLHRLEGSVLGPAAVNERPEELGRRCCSLWFVADLRDRFQRSPGSVLFRRVFDERRRLVALGLLEVLRTSHRALPAGRRPPQGLHLQLHDHPDGLAEASAGRRVEQLDDVLVRLDGLDDSRERRTAIPFGRDQLDLLERIVDDRQELSKRLGMVIDDVAIPGGMPVGEKALDRDPCREKRLGAYDP